MEKYCEENGCMCDMDLCEECTFFGDDLPRCMLEDMIICDPDLE